MLAGLVHGDALKERATGGSWEAGVELKDEGLASLRVIQPTRVVAMVWDGRAEKVELHATERGLAWRCSCGLSGALGYCSHAVATILLYEEREARACERRRV
jgi:uncharacterized Zn finger protein